MNYNNIGTEERIDVEPSLVGGDFSMHTEQGTAWHEPAVLQAAFDLDAVVLY